MSYVDKNDLIQAYVNHIPDAPDESGAHFQIDTFLLFEALGWGGMAAVFLAVDKDSGRRVVVKLPLPENLYDADYAELFKREQAAAQELGMHDSIVFFDTFGTFRTITGGNAPFLVLQYVAGRTLAKKIATWRYLPQREVCRIGIEMCGALGFMHPKYTHRDIKPANVLLDALNGEAVRVVDFGLAISVDNEADSLSQVSGTAGYIAPERFTDPAGTRNSPKADLFSLGCLLYKAVTGKKAFPSLVENILPTFLPVAPSLLRANLDLNLEALIVELISRDPNARPENARGVGDRLKRIQQQLPFETDPLWPVVSDPAISGHLAGIGRDHLAPCTSDIRNPLAKTFGLVERLELSNEIHNEIRKFGDGIQTGFLQELKKNDAEQISKSLVAALVDLKAWRSRVVVIADEFARLTSFSRRAWALSEQLQKFRRELESHASAVGMPISPEALGDSAELRLIDMTGSPELEAILWNIWKQLMARELEMVEDQLFVADLLSVALHGLEARLT